MKHCRIFLWLLSLLLLTGQQAGLLHRLGHDIDSLQFVGALAVDNAAQDGRAPAKDNDADAACALCVGFGGAVLASADLVDDLPALAHSFVRPLAAAPHRRSCFLSGTPIRGPPAGFSDYV